MTDGHLDRIDEEEELEVAGINDLDISEGDDESENSNTDEIGTNIRPAKVMRNTPKQDCSICLDIIHSYQKHLQPCRCRFWVHHQCLVTGILKYEAEHRGCAPLGCRFCKTRYNIWPRENVLVKALEKVSLWYDSFCDFGFDLLVIVTLDGAFTLYGLDTLFKIYGAKEGTQQILSMDPIKAVAKCKAIPLAAICINSIPWETQLLRLLRRCSRLPVVGAVFPSWNPQVREVRRRRTLFGVLVGGLLLPVHASIMGGLLFDSVESRVHRFLLGGVAFIAIKGVLQMYYRQKMYARQCHMSVLSYNGD